MPIDPTMNVPQAAERLGVSRRTIYNMVNDGRLTGRSVPDKGVRVDVASVEQVEQRQREALAGRKG